MRILVTRSVRWTNEQTDEADGQPENIMPVPTLSGGKGIITHTKTKNLTLIPTEWTGVKTDADIQNLNLNQHSSVTSSHICVPICSLYTTVIQYTLHRVILIIFFFIFQTIIIAQMLSVGGGQAQYQDLWHLQWKGSQQTSSDSTCLYDTVQLCAQRLTLWPA